MIVLFTGDHIRHNYLVDSFSKTFSEITWIIEKRENYMPNIDRNYCAEINKLQKIHFEKRLEAEKKFFKSDAGDFSKNKVIQIIKINRKDISNGKLKKIISKIKIKLFITYGVGKIPKKILKDLNCYKWNIHGGLSPWYRGAITHFWPSYLLEPEFTGMTLHELTEDIDGGGIIHQSISKLNVKDGIHQNACRTVKSFLRSSFILVFSSRIRGSTICINKFFLFFVFSICLISFGNKSILTGFTILLFLISFKLNPLSL